MALYRGSNKLAGIGKGFNPENTGTTGQVLTKTDTGYAYEDSQGGGEELPYLCFTANLAGSTVKLHKQGSPTAVTLETSTDGNTWSNYTFDTDITLSNVGDKVYWRNTSTTDTGFSTSTSDYYKFVMTGSISASGDTNYLLNKNSTMSISSYCFTSLFQECISLTTAPKIPATTLDTRCYYSMFNNCRSLVEPPILPATTLAQRCYGSMFGFCLSLVRAPALPATTLAKSCYATMFSNCRSLVVPPKLPATTLADDCYNGMFCWCYSLSIPPELPATTLARNCYAGMFQNCSSLIALPRLPATTLADYCYSYMFQDCISLGFATSSTGIYTISYRIPTTGTGTSGSSPLLDMFKRTNGSFTGTPSINTTYYTNGDKI